ncbi:MAG: hypothetical protein NZ889_01195 [Candidatus Pacearchaeota archaeon]|nr:hypothetical protein [Candidatus Pacearchaeota archaeon]
MEKMILPLIFIFIFISAFLGSAQFVFAQESQQVKRAYSWLQGKTIGKWQNLSLQQHAFSLLALQNILNANQTQNVIKALLAKSYNNGTCFGVSRATSETECTLLETAIAKFVLDEFAQDTRKAEEWLLNKTIVFYPSSAYLQIIQEREKETECRIIHENGVCDVRIKKDDRIVILQQQGNCFSLEQAWPYALRINLECMKKIFNITCNESASVNFLFQQTGEWYLFGETKYLQVENQTPVEVKSYCIGIRTCNYEATLWSAISLKEKTNLFLPYLLMQKNFPENKKFLPDAFLYRITSRESFASSLASIQKQDGLFQESNNKYYDTALAFLFAKEKLNESKAKETLLQEQKRPGYWECIACDSIRDTSLLLRALWPYHYIISECETEGFDCVSNCSAAGGQLVQYSCEQGECCNLSSYSCEERYGTCKVSCNANEIQLSYSCPSGVCCKPRSRASCIQELRGKICLSTENCMDALGNIIPFAESSDPRCCLGNCTRQACVELGGEICLTEEGKSCSNWIIANEFCCRRGHCIEGLLPCEQQGRICSRDESCEGTLVVASNTNNEAICCIGRCLPKTCENKCEEEERCKGETFETMEGLCCEGKCLKKCVDLNGVPCNSTKICKGRLVESYDFQRCCIGVCKQKRGFPFFIVIIVAVAALFAFFFFKKFGKKKEEKSFPFEGFEKHPRIQRPSQIAMTKKIPIPPKRILR